MRERERRSKREREGGRERMRQTERGSKREREGGRERMRQTDRERERERERERALPFMAPQYGQTDVFLHFSQTLFFAVFLCRYVIGLLKLSRNDLRTSGCRSILEQDYKQQINYYYHLPQNQM